jgi:CBS domain-containing protein
MTGKQPAEQSYVFDAEVSDQDVYDAMKDVDGYLDVKASDIMSKPVLTVQTDTPLKEVAAFMAEHRISGLPVLDGEGKIAGVISEKDFISRLGSSDNGHVMDIIARCLQGGSCLAAPVRVLYARDIMTAPAVTISESSTMFEIMELFCKKMINRVPVLDREGRMAGIVSRADIMRADLFRGTKSC